MRVLILGATGMAGHTITLYLREKGYDVTAFTRRKISFSKNIVGDISNFSALKNIIREGDYNAIINAIGILNEEAESDKSHAVLINAYLPHYLSEITKDLKTKIIHMSTDCVFSGKTGGYSENSLRDGKTFYDRSKALGELENAKDLTFRNSIVGPDLNKDGIGLFNWFMKQNSTINGYTKAIWTGVTTLTLAKAIDRALSEDLVGLYNLVNNETISKYDLLKLFNKHLKNNDLDIRPSNQITVDKSLINNRTDFNFEVPTYEVMVTEMKEWIYNYKDFYPHYNIKE